MNQTVKGYLFAVLSAVIYGCMPLMAKHIYADGVNPLTLVFLRNLFSLIPLELLALRERETLKIKACLLPSVGMISLLGCCVASFILCLATGSLALPSTLLGWGMSVLFSLLVTTGAVVLFQESTFLVGGEIASILSTLEPITSTVIGILVFSEPFGIRMILGTALVVTASLLTALFNLREKPEAQALRFSKKSV